MHHEQYPDPPRHRQCPLTVAGNRQDIFDQVRRYFRHSPPGARTTQCSALTTQRDYLLVATCLASRPNQAIRQDAAALILIEFISNMRRITSAACAACFGLRKQRCLVLAHHAVEYRGLRSSPRVRLRSPSMAGGIGIATCLAHEATERARRVPSLTSCNYVQVCPPVSDLRFPPRTLRTSNAGAVDRIIDVFQADARYPLSNICLCKEQRRNPV